jgi:hypothetical protein
LTTRNLGVRRKYFLENRIPRMKRFFRFVNYRKRLFQWKETVAPHLKSRHWCRLTAPDKGESMFNRVYSPLIATALTLIASISLCRAQEAAQQPASPEIREAWRKSMVRIPLPKNGCFKAQYPSAEWQEVQCGRPSPYLNQGGKGAVTNQAGDGNDYVAKASGPNFISSSTGSFLQIAGGSSANGENAYLPGTGQPFVPCTGSLCVNNIFTLQMNSQSPVNSSDLAPFFTPACSTAPNGAAGCSGWEQFLFSTTQGPPPGSGQQSTPGAPGTTPGVFIEYWLYGYGSPCPALPSWATLQGNPSSPLWQPGNLPGSCVLNGPVSYFPPQTAADLPFLVMQSTVTTSTDKVTLANINTGAMAVYQEPSALDLAQAWTESEFNVFGDCCATQATFTSPTVLVVQTSIDNMSGLTPACIANDGTTGETNDLNFEPTAAPVCCSIGGSNPAIQFMEVLDNVHTHTAWCTPSSLEGDPHITTEDGTHYNFQGAGEFVSLQDSDGAEIQTRQKPVSTSFIGSDPYDNLTTCVSLNTAVAARVGEHRVTWEPNLSGVPDPSGLQLRVDGALTTLGASGLALGTSGRVAPQAGGALEVDFPDGKTLLVTPTWWPSQSEWYLNVDVSNLGLVSADNTATGRGIAGVIAGGSWLPALPGGASVGPMPASLPARYNTLYKKFADAWRVDNKDSLFDYAPGTSTDTFTNKDWPSEKPPCVARDEKPLEPGSEALAHAACRQIKDPNRRADCIFDVRATGDLIFAKSYLVTQRIVADSTTTSLTTDTDPTQIGEWVTFTASVAAKSSASTSIPSGRVQFAVDGADIGEPVPVNGKGGAKWETSQLKVGTHRITATYLPGADSVFLPSTSLEEFHTVKRCFCDAEHEEK